MHSDNLVRSIGSSCNLCDGEGRSIGCDDSFRLYKLIKFFEESLLSFHFFCGSFDDKICILDDGDVCGTLNASHNFVLLIFGHLFFSNHLSKVLLYCSKTLVYGFLTSSSHYYFVTILSQNLDDASTHGACS